MSAQSITTPRKRQDHFTRWHNHAERCRRQYLDAINPCATHANIMEAAKRIHATLPKGAPAWVWQRASEAARTWQDAMYRYEIAYCVHEIRPGVRITDPWGPHNPALLAQGITAADLKEAQQACRENRNVHFHFWKKTGIRFA